jgi:hypothetical protein
MISDTFLRAKTPKNLPANYILKERGNLAQKEKSFLLPPSLHLAL